MPFFGRFLLTLSLFQAPGAFAANASKAKAPTPAKPAAVVGDDDINSELVKPTPPTDPKAPPIPGAPKGPSTPPIPGGPKGATTPPGPLLPQKIGSDFFDNVNYSGERAVKATLLKQDYDVILRKGGFVGIGFSAPQYAQFLQSKSTREQNQAAATGLKGGSGLVNA